ncbi:hypothetical protein ACIBF1_22425 [Spirillospora sp. NPDC050679]
MSGSPTLHPAVATAGRPDRAGPGDPPAGPARRRWRLALLLGWLGQAVVRLVLAAGQSMPVATPDETGYLFAARVLTGGPGADMSYGTVYRGGYPLLLTPAFGLADDPAVVYRLVQVENALISALMLPLAYVLLRRCGLARLPAFLGGNLTALLPGVVFFAEFALTDAVLPVVVLGWLLLAHSWLSAPRGVPALRIALPRDASGVRAVLPRVAASPAALYGAGASALAAYAYMCHTRGVLPLLVHAGLVVLAAARWRSWREAAAAGAVLAGVALAGTRLNHGLLPSLYPNGDNDLSGNLVRRLSSADGWGWTLGLGSGQLWYQLAVTGGVAGIGLLTLAALVLRRGVPGRSRALALAVLAVAAGIALATSAALPDEYRVGNYVYGRYLACVTPVLFALGLAVLLRARRRTAAWAAAGSAGLLAGLASIVDRYAGDRLARYTFTPYDFPETSFLTWDWTQFRLWPATFAGLALLAVVLLGALLPGASRRAGTAVLTCVLAAVFLGAEGTANARIGRPLVEEFSAATDLRGVADPATTPVVAVDRNISWRLRLPLYYWLAWDDVADFDGRQAPPRGADLVIVYWDGRTPVNATWPGGAPADRQVVDSRHSPNDGWVAWGRKG